MAQSQPVSELLNDVLDAVLYFDKKQVVEADGVKLHPSEIHMLMCALEGMSFTRIAGHFGVSKAAVSQVFTRLGAKGVVVVEKDRSRKNAATVSLTPLGHAVHAQAVELRAHIARTLERHLSGYSPAERAVVARFLGDLRGFIGEAIAGLPGSASPSTSSTSNAQGGAR